jgi:hypothetical protein
MSYSKFSDINSYPSSNNPLSNKPNDTTCTSPPLSNINSYSTLTTIRSKTRKHYVDTDSYSSLTPIASLTPIYSNTRKHYANKDLQLLFCFWDIETGIMRKNNNQLKDISISWFYLIEYELLTFDFYKREKYYKSLCKFNYIPNGIYNEKLSSLDMFIEDLFNISKNYNIKLVGFNSSGFDCLLLLNRIKEKYIINNEIEIKTFPVKNRIYTFKIGNITSLDLMLHIRMSLFDACNSFNSNPKKIDTDIMERIQKKIDDNTFENKDIQDNFKNELEEYNIHDILCLASLLKNYNEMYSKIELTKDIISYNYLTLPSLINNGIFKRLYIKYDVRPPKNRNDFIEIKKTARGGIVGIMGYSPYSIYIENIYIFDIVSQYPYVCIKYDYPSGDYNFDRFENGKEPDLVNKLGIYYCKVNQSKLHIPLTPKRIKVSSSVEKNIWNTQINEEIAPLTTYGIKYLRMKKINVQILYGWTWEKKCKMFRDYMCPLANFKIEQDKLEWRKNNNLSYDRYDEYLRNFYKLMLVSATGAVNKKLYETKISFNNKLEPFRVSPNIDKKRRNDKLEYDIKQLELNYQNTYNLSCPQLATFIYETARIELLKIANELENEVIYCDTDSLFITDRGVDILYNNPKFKNKIARTDIEEKIGEFGKIKFEGKYKGCYFIAKKLYCCFKRFDIPINKYCYPICNCPEKLYKKNKCNGGMWWRCKGVMKDTSYNVIVPQLNNDTKIINSSHTIRDINMFKALFYGYSIKTYRKEKLKRDIKRDFKLHSINQVYIIQPNRINNDVNISVLSVLIISLKKIISNIQKN